tara:strand:- start:158 stop:331 length:174 start_codon:yes stop_codon:yes gene_type:complete
LHKEGEAVMTINNTNMLFNLKEIKEAVDWATGDDGFRGKEVVEILKQTRLNEDPDGK